MSSAKVIDLNVDVGEGFPYDEDLIGLASTANIACGAHAGSQELASHLSKVCHSKGTRICAHPGYPDRENMGRLSKSFESAEEESVVMASLRNQLSILDHAKAIKPHGALYHDTANRESHAALLVNLLIRVPLPLIGFPIGWHARAAAAAGVKFLREGFADRRYGDDGLLVPRSQPNAVLVDEKEIREQVRDLATKVDTICLHGDNPHCVEVARLVRAALVEEGWTISSSR